MCPPLRQVLLLRTWRRDGHSRSSVRSSGPGGALTNHHAPVAGRDFFLQEARPAQQRWITGDQSMSKDRHLRGELELPPLPTYIKEGLNILFIGFNPGERAAQIGHYYGYPGNRFWWLLHHSGLTPSLLKPEEDHTMLDLGYGLTDIVARPSKSSADLAGWELRQGREELLDRLRTYRPRIACYNGKGVYQALTGQRKVSYGRQPTSCVDGVVDFVAASPSGRSREPQAYKLQLYIELRHLAEQMRKD